MSTSLYPPSAGSSTFLWTHIQVLGGKGLRWRKRGRRSCQPKAVECMTTATVGVQRQVASESIFPCVEVNTITFV